MLYYYYYYHNNYGCHLYFVKMNPVNSTDFQGTTDDMGDDDRNSVFGIPIPDEAVYAIIAVGGALLLILCCSCCLIVCLCIKKRRQRRKLTAQIRDVIRVDSTDDLDDYYVNYGEILSLLRLIYYYTSDVLEHKWRASLKLHFC